MRRRGALALAGWGAAAALLPRRLAAAVPMGPFALDGEAIQGGLMRGRAPAGTRGLSLDGRPLPIAPDGLFLIAFDRDAPAAALLAADTDHGPLVQNLAIAKRAWRIENLSTLPKHQQPEPEFLALRMPELAAIKAARAEVTDAQGWRQHFRWPAAGRQSGFFGSQRVYRGEPGEYHSGADIAVGTGTPVMAPADGVVILAADHPFTLEGNLLMIDHGMGLNSALLHNSALLVRHGDRVAQGQIVSRSGMTGRATGPHLHWSLRWHDARIDPLLVVGAPPRA